MSYGEKAMLLLGSVPGDGRVEWMELEGNSQLGSCGPLNVRDNAPAHRGEAVRPSLGSLGQPRATAAAET